MKTKLFIMAMLLMPMMFGCSKDNNVDQRLVGDWFLFYYEQTNNDYIDPSYNDSFSETYTKKPPKFSTHLTTTANVQATTGKVLWKVLAHGLRVAAS